MPVPDAGCRVPVPDAGCRVPRLPRLPGAVPDAGCRMPVAVAGAGGHRCPWVAGADWCRLPVPVAGAGCRCRLPVYIPPSSSLTGKQPPRYKTHVKSRPNHLARNIKATLD